MRKTKLLALLLAVAMIASMVVPSVSAAGTTYVLSVVDANGEATMNANAGDIINVYVALSENPGISCLAFDLSIPDGWVFEYADQGLFSGTTAYDAATAYQAGPDGTYHLWLMATGIKGSALSGVAAAQLPTHEGNLLELTMLVPADAVSGEYTIDLTPDLVNCFYYNVDSDGVIIPDGGNTKQVPTT